MDGLEYWSWDRCCSKIRGLRGRLGFENSEKIEFLKLSLSLRDGSISDELIKGRKLSPYEIKGIYCILYGYADSSPLRETNKLISFRQVPGGRFYYEPFAQRVLRPLERAFGPNPELLVEAGKVLGGVKSGYGDFSVKIYSLPLVPLTVVLYAGDEEFPPSANILYDSSVIDLLSTERIVMLSELTVSRLRHALGFIRRD
ncbi:MAG: hypothetical protein DRO05_03475 [Thermoproteota archaeon]|nr:MAG: hypothetical protein DRO05_03475 [Candidatus Korarchaeota archaeon]